MANTVYDIGAIATPGPMFRRGADLVAHVQSGAPAWAGVTFVSAAVVAGRMQVTLSNPCPAGTDVHLGVILV